MKYLLLFIFSIAVNINMYGQQAAAKYTKEINYLVYLPDGYDNNKSEKWPLLVFLHGAGASGNDLEKVKQGGIPLMIENGKKFPFIVFSPQSPEHGWNVRDIKELLINEVQKYRVDVDRIYLTGLSMGGNGTWELAVTYPEYFAAIIPICASPDHTVANNIFQLRHTPVWCFHGSEDKIADPDNTKKLMTSLRKYNPDAKLTVYPGIGHDSWTMTYNNDSIYQWLLQHIRYDNKEIKIDENILKEYSSYKYAIPGQSEIAGFTVEDGRLRLWTDNRKGVLLKPQTEETFFLDERSRQYLTFERDEKGRVKGVTLYQFNNNIFCKRADYK